MFFRGMGVLSRGCCVEGSYGGDTYGANERINIGRPPLPPQYDNIINRAACARGKLRDISDVLVHASERASKRVGSAYIPVICVPFVRPTWRSSMALESISRITTILVISNDCIGRLFAHIETYRAFTARVRSYAHKREWFAAENVRDKFRGDRPLSTRTRMRHIRRK